MNKSDVSTRQDESGVLKTGREWLSSLSDEELAIVLFGICGHGEYISNFIDCAPCLWGDMTYLFERYVKLHGSKTVRAEIKPRKMFERYVNHVVQIGRQWAEILFIEINHIKITPVRNETRVIFMRYVLFRSSREK